MPKYVVRLWVDIEVEAEDEAAAKRVGRDASVEVGEPVYDIQVANVYVVDGD